MESSEESHKNVWVEIAREILKEKNPADCSDDDNELDQPLLPHYSASQRPQ